MKAMKGMQAMKVMKGMKAMQGMKVMKVMKVMKAMKGMTAMPMKATQEEPTPYEVEWMPAPSVTTGDEKQHVRTDGGLKELFVEADPTVEPINKNIT